MITLHHLENSQSFRIVWLLEELGSDYQIKIYARDPISSLATTEYKALHPAGTAPVISDGETTLAETNAIVDYLLDRHPHSTLRPAIDAPQRTAYLYWLHTAQGSMTPMLLMLFVFGRMTEKSPALFRPIIRKITQKAAQVLPMPRIKALLQAMDDTLAHSPYLAGEVFTAADIVMAYNLDGIENRLQLFKFADDYPNIAAYVQRLQARDAYQAAVKKEKPSEQDG